MIDLIFYTVFTLAFIGLAIYSFILRRINKELTYLSNFRLEELTKSNNAQGIEIENFRIKQNKEIKAVHEKYTNDYYKTALDSLANLTENTDVPPAIRLDASIQLMLSISPVTPTHNTHLRHTNG